MDTKHRWNVSPRRAIQIQRELRSRLILVNGFDRLTLIGGADVSYSRRKNRVYAALTVFEYDTMTLVDVVYAQAQARFPYIPGLLTFREGPVVLKAFRRLREHPDVIIFDGQGIAHPRRMGLASHMGILLGIPTIGCAKSPLRVQFKEPGDHRGRRTRMMAAEEQVGVVLRTRDHVQPVYVSPGHLVDIPTSAQVVLSAGRGYRLPEPTRIAHQKVGELRRMDEKRE